MSDRKLIAFAEVQGTYGVERVRLEQLNRPAHFRGHYVTRGAGLAGRVVYRTEDKARRVVQSHRGFIRWED